jgi:hypothetical protein
MAQGKQAKILTTKQEACILHPLSTTRYPLRDRYRALLEYDDLSTLYYSAEEVGTYSCNLVRSFSALYA